MANMALPRTTKLAIPTILLIVIGIISIVVFIKFFHSDENSQATSKDWSLYKNQSLNYQFYYPSNLTFAPCDQNLACGIFYEPKNPNNKLISIQGIFTSCAKKDDPRIKQAEDQVRCNFPTQTKPGELTFLDEKTEKINNLERHAFTLNYQNQKTIYTAYFFDKESTDSAKAKGVYFELGDRRYLDIFEKILSSITFN
jgi:hypothetical protein